MHTVSTVILVYYWSNRISASSCCTLMYTSQSLIPYPPRVYSIPAVSQWSQCCHSNQTTQLLGALGFSTTGPRWHPGLPLVTCWSAIYPAAYVTKTENKTVGVCFLNWLQYEHWDTFTVCMCLWVCASCVHLQYMCVSQTQHGAISTRPPPVSWQRVSTAGHKPEGGEPPLKKLVETSVLSLASCCLSECAITGQRVTLPD